MAEEKVQPKILTKVAQPSVTKAVAVEATLQEFIAAIEPFLPDERTPSNWQFEPSEKPGCNLCTNLRTGRQLDIPMPLFNHLLRN
jgi:hypothetical protein